MSGGTLFPGGHYILRHLNTILLNMNGKEAKINTVPLSTCTYICLGHHVCDTHHCSITIRISDIQPRPRYVESIICAPIIELSFQVSGRYLQCTDSSHGYACPQCFCPNAKIIYTCELTNLEGTTRWVLPSNQCTTSGGSDQIQLSQAAGCGGIVATCGGFRATNMAVNRTTTCRVSELEVTTSDKLDGGVVKCSSINLRGDILEEYWSYPIVIISKCCVVLCCVVLCCVVFVLCCVVLCCVVLCCVVLCCVVLCCVVLCCVVLCCVVLCCVVLCCVVLCCVVLCCVVLCCVVLCCVVLCCVVLCCVVLCCVVLCCVVLCCVVLCCVVLCCVVLCCVVLCCVVLCCVVLCCVAFMCASVVIHTHNSQNQHKLPLLTRSPATIV